MGKTGGGIGTNQFQQRGTSVERNRATTGRPAYADVSDLGDTAALDLNQVPEGFYPRPVTVSQPDPATLRVTLASGSGDEQVDFVRAGDGSVVVVQDGFDGPEAYPINQPDSYGPWCPGWVANFYDPDYSTTTGGRP